MKIHFPAYHFENNYKLDDNFGFSIQYRQGRWYSEIWFNGETEILGPQPAEQLWLFNWERVLPNSVAEKIYRKKLKRGERRIIARLKEEKGYPGPYQTWI